MAELVAAGAPALPDGWFYRVCDSGFALKVEVRERRKRFGSRAHSYAYVRDDENSGLTAVVRSCQHAVKTLQEERALRQNTMNAAMYLGDHDPKGGR